MAERRAKKRLLGSPNRLILANYTFGAMERAGECQQGEIAKLFARVETGKNIISDAEVFDSDGSTLMTSKSLSQFPLKVHHTEIYALRLLKSSLQRNALHRRRTVGGCRWTHELEQSCGVFRL